MTTMLEEYSNTLRSRGCSAGSSPATPDCLSIGCSTTITRTRSRTAAQIFHRSWKKSSNSGRLLLALAVVLVSFTAVSTVILVGMLNHNSSDEEAAVSVSSATSRSALAENGIRVPKQKQRLRVIKPPISDTENENERLPRRKGTDTTKVSARARDEPKSSKKEDSDKPLFDQKKQDKREQQQQQPSANRPTTGESSTTTASWPPKAQLDALLGHAPKKKRLVVAAANSGYVDFADNWAHSLRKLGVTNFVIVPLDAGAYKVLHPIYPRHVLPVWSGGSSTTTTGNNDAVTEAADFATEAFKRLTSTRPSFLLRFLEQGYTIFYNDIDMVWRSNAWDVLDELDRQAQQDANVAEANNDTSVSSPQYSYSTAMLWDDGPIQVCSCFLYLPPSPASIALLQQWRDSINANSNNGDTSNDQMPFMQLLDQKGLSFGVHRFADDSSNNNVQNQTSSGLIRLIENNDHFPHGGKYFDENQQQQYDRSQAVIVHNNYIIGKQNKLDRFVRYDLWKPSGKLGTSAEDNVKDETRKRPQIHWIRRGEAGGTGHLRHESLQLPKVSDQ